MKKIIHIVILSILSIFYFGQNAAAQIGIEAYTNCDSVTVVLLGGTAPYTVSLSNMTQSTNNTTVTFKNVQTGLQLISVKDANGLTGQASVFIEDCGSIIGPEVSCIGSCEEYFFSGEQDSLVSWTLNLFGNVVAESSSSPFNVCWEESGIYTLIYSNGFSTATFTVYVEENYFIDINTVTSSMCQDTSNCEKVCAHTASIYSAEGFGHEWTVQGADNYTITGNQIKIEWGEPGSGFISVLDDSQQCLASGAKCIQILEEPNPVFTTLPATNNGVVKVCEGGTVIFNNESTNASIFEWNFGDGTLSTSTNEEHVYDTPGTYQVTLIARNDCFCGDTTTISVEVIDAIAPTIDCTGTICAGDTVTYTTAANCGDFSWSITGDYNILSGGTSSDNYIQIEWLDGPNGIIELSVANCSGGNYCLAPMIETIPILSNDAKIYGPDKVCKKDEVTYSIDDYSATDFTWIVSNGGIIIEGQNTNSIIVLWKGKASSTNPQTVSVDYSSCYLGCGGSDQIDVYILPKFFVEGDIEVCKNGTSHHAAKKETTGTPAVNCDWTILSNSGAVVWASSSPTDKINIDWLSLGINAGKYTLQATPTDAISVCGSEYTSYINVVQPPDAPTGIDGELKICPGTSYTYEATSTNPDNIFNWTIYDGSNITNKTGKNINVIFGNTPPYSLSATQTSTSGLACESEAVSINLTKILNLNLTGADQVCEETKSTFTTDLIDNGQYDWVIAPAYAGSIVTGQGTNSIEVFWHGPGSADVSVAMCALSENINVSIIAKPEPAVTGDLFVCPGATTTISTSESYSSYLWKTEAGNTLSNTATAALGKGAFELVVTNSLGCINNTSFEIEAFPDPGIHVSVNGSRGRCYLGTSPDAPAEIHATEIPTGYTYQWYLNDVALTGETSSTLYSSEFGGFKVAVVDQYGCENFSNTTTIFDYCGGGVCNNPDLSNKCLGGTDVKMSFTSTGVCSIFNFQNNSPNYVPGTVHWYFDDYNSPNNQSTLENPTHDFSHEGHYIVTITAKTPAGKLCWDAKLITVPVAANFDFGTACANEVIEFQDVTGFLPGEVLTTWSWDFGDAASGSDNISTDENPSHIFSGVGVYDVTLTVTNAGGCSSTITREVIVQPSPTITFDIPNFTCEATALEFFAQASPNTVNYNWSFGNPTSGIADTSEIKNPYHSFDNIGDYLVTCKATNIWGCTNSITKTISIEPNTLDGTISFSTPSPICEGSTTTLTAPGGATSWLWSNASNTESIILGTAESLNVTISDDKGCTYTTPFVVLDIIPEPTTTIQAIEYDEFGQPTNVIYDSYVICDGEDVFLQVTDNGNYSYTWSNGETKTNISFTEDRGNLLTAGTYTYTVDILDNTTGCTNTVGPFSIVVHPSPTNIQISSNATPPICASSLTTLSVDNPQSDLTYTWNTGVFANSIQVISGGTYQVIAISAFGCTGESNEVKVLAGPDIKKVPNGCQERCGPDTICLPNMPNVVNYQWYLDGVAIPSPAGNIANLVAQESGSYHVEMTDNIGCLTVSDALNLDLYEGRGTIKGAVYMDVNDNGIIDTGDTLVSSVPIIINQNGSPIDTAISDTDGAYAFTDILSTNYVLQIDETVLPNNIVPIYNSLDTTLVGCDDLIVFDWLLHLECANPIFRVEDTICYGESYIVNGTTIPPNTPTTIQYAGQWGCDSTVVYTIYELPNLDIVTILYGCIGDSIAYNGTSIAVEATVDFYLTSPEGCSYTETVTVLGQPISSPTKIAIEICDGTTADFDGKTLDIGTETDFTFTNQYGCDSIVTVSVNSLPLINYSFTTTQTCWNQRKGIINITASGVQPIEYSLDGINYQKATSFDNLLPNTYQLRIRDGNGCEAKPKVLVEPLPRLTFELSAPKLPCDGSDVLLESTILSGDFSPLDYLWNTGVTSTQQAVNEADIYALSITNECETVSKEFRVSYETDREDYIYIPNTFSPNGDGKNDFLEYFVAPNVVVEDIDFSVYDRWGKIIFQSHELNEAWNASTSGKRIASGVYIYYLKAKLTSCGNTFDFMKKGDVTITY